MAKHQHLERAPVIEAILGFEANASSGWNPTDVKIQLKDLFADFPNVQEQREFESSFKIETGKQPESFTKIHDIKGFIVQKSDNSAAVQIRRDGFAYSQLQPYPTWEKFIANALKEWKIYSRHFEIEVPHSVFIRFINRVSYPAKNFKLSKYFQKSPAPPEETEWEFGFFREHYDYRSKDRKFTITSIFSRAGTDPEKLSNLDFIFDLIITPVVPLAELGITFEDLLPEMRSLKNLAFFAKFTEDGLKPFK